MDKALHLPLHLVEATACSAFHVEPAACARDPTLSCIPSLLLHGFTINARRSTTLPMSLELVVFLPRVGGFDTEEHAENVLPARHR